MHIGRDKKKSDCCLCVCVKMSSSSTNENWASPRGSTFLTRRWRELSQMFGRELLWCLFVPLAAYSSAPLIRPEKDNRHIDLQTQQPAWFTHQFRLILCSSVSWRRTGRDWQLNCGCDAPGVKRRAVLISEKCGKIWPTVLVRGLEGSSGQIWHWKIES